MELNVVSEDFLASVLIFDTLVCVHTKCKIIHFSLLQKPNL